MARINVFLKDQLLEELDREAKAERTKRSAFIQKALTNYLETARRIREEEESRRRMAEACRKMDRLATKLGKWEPGRVIRNFRDTALRGDK